MISRIPSPCTTDMAHFSHILNSDHVCGAFPGPRRDKTMGTGTRSLSFFLFRERVDVSLTYSFNMKISSPCTCADMTHFFA